jgi:NAD+ kinase
MRARIFHNAKKKWAVALAREVGAFLKQKGIGAGAKKADFTVVIGGDGTILYNRDKLEGAVFGIGSKRSFICQCTKENWEEALSSFIAKPAFEERMMLSVLVGKKKYSALNDVAILSRAHEVLTLAVDIGQDSCTFDADGVVLSTPTGSTAYAYAAGGPVIEPTLEVFSLVPVAPDKRLFDPMVISSSHKVAISSQSPAHMVIDGEKPILLKRGEVVKISRNSRKILFAVK